MADPAVPVKTPKRRKISATAAMSSTEEKLRQLNLLVKSIIIRELWKENSAEAKSLGNGFVFDRENNTLKVDGIDITVEVTSYGTEIIEDSQSEASSRSGEDEKALEYI
jgi:hypothetical protein